jgi:23S rRNA pseudouridine2605 synthase
MGTRLVRYLAQCGAASRRGAAELVQAGRVRINGEVTTNVALQVEPGDKVLLDGKPLSAPSECRVFLLNKPLDVVCSLRDPHNPKTVLDCFPQEIRAGLKPVGRLDKNTTGLLLLTDDGDLAFRLTHPRYKVTKTYRVTVNGEVSDATIRALREGVMLDDGPTAPAGARRVEYDSERDQTILELRIHEGRNRQVRRMCEAVGYRARRLMRTEYGPLQTGRLKFGEYRALTPNEVRALRSAVREPE